MELTIVLLLAEEKMQQKIFQPIVLGLHDYTSTYSTNNYDTIPHHYWLPFSPLNIDLLIILIILIFYNITFGPFHPNKIDCKV